MDKKMKQNYILCFVFSMAFLVFIDIFIYCQKDMILSELGAKKIVIVGNILLTLLINAMYFGFAKYEYKMQMKWLKNYPDTSDLQEAIHLLRASGKSSEELLSESAKCGRILDANYKEKQSNSVQLISIVVGVVFALFTIAFTTQEENLEIFVYFLNIIYIIILYAIPMFVTICLYSISDRASEKYLNRIRLIKTSIDKMME